MECAITQKHYKNLASFASLADQYPSLSNRNSLLNKACPPTDLTPPSSAPSASSADNNQPTSDSKPPRRKQNNVSVPF